ncbi:MAG: S-methyl-5-thioribose-1-phosphate isomerase, partial [Tumebacillaceae bacterium]
MQPLRWNGKALDVLDQTLLPDQEIWETCDTYELVAEAIEKMKVRGAPAIGATAAYGIAVGAQAGTDMEKADFLSYLDRVCDRLAKTRPTAVNLFWAIKRMRALIAENNDLSVKELAELITRESELVAEEDVQINKAIGQNGLPYIPQNARILTHCNTGSLATVDYGTALGVIRAAQE